MSKHLIEITDKDLIVFLVAKSFQIHKIERDRNRSILYFQNTPEINKAILDYTNKSVDINIGEYLAAHKRVSTLLYFNKSKVN